jgi:hypothetical protein
MISGFNPHSFHLVNVLLHTLATYLFVVFSKGVLPTRLSVLLAGIIFALHPIHSEAVAGIVGRADILAAVFFLLALLAFKAHISARSREERQAATKKPQSSKNSNHHQDYSSLQCDKNGNFAAACKKQQQHNLAFEPYLAFTVIFAACAMFSKEQGVTVLGVCFVMDLLTTTKASKGQTLISLVIATIVLLTLRGRLMGFSPPNFAKADNPASASDCMLTRGLTLAFLPAYNFWLLLCPAQLSFDWSMDAIPLITNWSDPRNGISAAFYAGLALAGLYILKARQGGEKKALAAAFAVMVMSFLPATNVLFYVGFVIAERVLYIPSMGFCLLLGYGLAKFFKGQTACQQRPVRKMAAICALAILLATFGLRTLQRNRDWRDEESLYRSGLRVNPAKGELQFET